MKFHLILWDEAVWRVKSNNVKGFRHQRLLDMAGVQIVSKTWKREKVTLSHHQDLPFSLSLNYWVMYWNSWTFTFQLKRAWRSLTDFCWSLRWELFKWVFCNEVKLLVYQEKEGEEKGGKFCGEGKRAGKAGIYFCLSTKLLFSKYLHKKIQPRHLTLILSKLSISDWFLATSYWWYWWWFSSVKFWTVKSLTHQVDHQWGVNENVIAKEHVAVVVRFHLFAWIIEWVIIM